MIEMQYNSNNFQARGGVGGFSSSLSASSAYPPKRRKDGSFTNNEPISVLDTWSPSPSTSTSTTTQQGNIVLNEPPAAAARGGGEWVAHLPPCVHNVDNLGLQDWGNLGKQDEILNLLLQTGGSAIAPLTNAYSGYNASVFNISASGFSSNDDSLQCLAPTYMPFQPEFDASHHKVEILDPQGALNFVYNQVYLAAELIKGGDFSNARGILARLNHFSAPIGKPFIRSAFYVKEALEMAAMAAFNHFQRIPSPFDGDMMLKKMDAYNVFSQVSPVIQFMNFTTNQLILEAVCDAEKIHIIDFDIGFGAHWSSFLQEIPCKNRGVISVKITAFASPSTHHSLEITLMHQNLTEFASNLGINFELEVVNIDCFDPNCNSVSSLRSSESEAIAVNFPIWAFTSYLSAFPSYLSLIKRLSPKILVSLSRGCERIDLPFSHHILHIIEYYEALLYSVDAANVASDACNKFERLLFQPMIESTVTGRFIYPNKMPHWRNIFASLGYSPLSISSFAETQAQSLLKRMQVKGFRIERHEASLLLCWKRCELLSVSAWKC